MTDRELMQMALDALELLARYENPSTKVQVRKPRDGGPIVTMYPHKVATEAAVPLRARLAQPEPEPVAWMYEYGTDNGDAVNKVRWYKNVSLTPPVLTYNRDVVPLYPAPPQREWQGLTDEEVLDAWLTHRDTSEATDGFASAIEAKLKEKNG